MYEDEITQYIQNVLQRDPNPGEVESWQAIIDGGQSLEDVRDLIIDSAEAVNEVYPVILAYQAIYGRVPDAGGLDYWTGRYEAMLGLDNPETTTVNEALVSLLHAFVDSEQPEFAARYGIDPSGDQFVAAAYTNVLNRTPDQAGLNYWQGRYDAIHQQLEAQVAAGDSDMTPEQIDVATRAQILEQFVSSAEYENNTADLVDQFLANAAEEVDGAYTGSLWDLQDETGGITGETFTLTNSAITGLPDDLTGTDNNDAFNALGVTTLNTGDVVRGGDGDDALNANIAGAANVLPTLEGIENVNVTNTATAAAAASLDLSASTGVENVTVENINVTPAGGNTADVLVTGIQAGTDLNVQNVGNSVVAGNTVNFAFANAAVAGAADEANLTLNNVGTAPGTAGNGPAVTIAGGAGSASGVEIVNLDAAGNARVSSLNVFDNLVALNSTISTLNVTGSGDVRIDALDFAGNNTAATLDASAATGDVNVTLTGTENVTFTGGSGDDRINVNNSLTTADILDGGAGRDTVAVDNGQLAAGMQISNFEIVELTTALAGTLNTAQAGSGIDTVNLTAGGAGTINGLASGGTVGFSADTGNVTVNVTNATNAGTDDTLNLNLMGTDTDVGTITANGVENINIDSTAITPASGSANSIDLTGAAQVDDITLTGNQNVGLTGVVNSVDSVNGAALTGDLAFTATAGGTDGIAITGGSGDDALTGGSANDTIVGGAGDDTLAGDQQTGTTPAAAEQTNVTYQNVAYDVGDVVSVNVAGTTYSVTVGTGAGDYTGSTGIADILAGLAGQVNADGGAPAGATVVGGNILQLDGDIAGAGNGFTVTADVDNSSDVATSAATQILTSSPSDIATDTLGTDHITASVDGTSYNIGLEITDVGGTQTYAMSGDTAGLLLATGGQLIAVDANTGAITITGKADGTALNPVDFALSDSSTAPGVALVNTAAVNPASDQAQPTVVETTAAADGAPIYSASADVLTGGEGDDVFDFTAGGSGTPGATITNIDTITDLNLGGAGASTQVDQVDLAFAIGALANGGVAEAMTGAPSLTAAVNALFGAGGDLAGQANTAGLFTYDGDTYLVAQNGASGAFDADDVLINVTGVAGTLDITDFA